MRNLAGFVVIVLTATGALSKAAAAEGTKSPVKIDAAVVGNANNGEGLFKQRCAVCHSTGEPATANVGPNLRSVVGRPAASFPGFGYSKPLKTSKLNWSADKLDRFLADPQTLVKGTAMVMIVPKPEERSDLIAYLASLK